MSVLFVSLLLLFLLAFIYVPRTFVHILCSRNLLCTLSLESTLLDCLTLAFEVLLIHVSLLSSLASRLMHINDLIIAIEARPLGRCIPSISLRPRFVPPCDCERASHSRPIQALVVFLPF